MSFLGVLYGISIFCMYRDQINSILAPASAARQFASALGNVDVEQLAQAGEDIRGDYNTMKTCIEQDGNALKALHESLQENPAQYEELVLTAGGSHPD